MDISNQLSKAAHKYSYGTSKVTKETINVIIKEPFKIINDKDISPYLEFLNNLKESVNTNKILLKDSAKVVQYCDKMIETLPKFKYEIQEIILKINSLKDHEDKNSTLEKIKKIEEIIIENRKTIQNEISRKEEFTNQIIQEEERLKEVMYKVEEQLFHICKKKYRIGPSVNTIKK